MESQFVQLTDVSQPYDSSRIELVNSLISALYTGSQSERSYSNALLTRIKENPQAWMRCEEMLLSPQASLNTKFFSLSIYESASASRWMELPREKIITSVLGLIKTFASRGVQDEKPLLRKLDKVFVNAVRNEWLNGSEMWKSVIPQLGQLSGSDQNLWENTMTILCMLSEDIFDFGANTMTSRRVENLKTTLSEQFPHVQQLCELVLSQYLQSPQGTVKISLVNAALSTMSHYLKWVPQAILFQSNLIDLLISKFWDSVSFRIETVKCLTEAFSVSVGPGETVEIAQRSEYQQKMSQWIVQVAEKLNQLPRSIVLEKKAPGASERLFYETFFNQVSIMVHAIVRNNFYVANQNISITVQMMQILVRITDISSEEVFKSFVDMWLMMTDSLVGGARKMLISAAPAEPDILDAYIAGDNNKNILSSSAVVTPLVISQYLPVLLELGKVLILHMAQPPEVTIVETDDGNIERADMKETAEIDLYNSMSRCLQNITYIDRSLVEGTLLGMLKDLLNSVRSIMSSSSKGQEQENHWNSQLLSKITWAAGSIAGVTPSADAEGAEKRFTFEMIRDLLSLCNLHNSKTNRAIVASNVLFYCAKHHRFLRSNHKFLRTVFKKLFEFMAEPTVGVKEMASDTFLIICRSCSHKLVDAVAEGGSNYAPFVDSLVAEVQNFIQPLEALQKCTVFEAIGYMVFAIRVEDMQRQQSLCSGFLSPFLQKWVHVLSSANANPNILFELEIVRELSLFLRVLERFTLGVGRGAVVEPIVVQIYEDMLRLYRVYSETVTLGASQNKVNWEAFKLMRKVKGDCLRLISTFVEVSVKPKGGGGEKHSHSVAASIFPRLLDYVIEDYRSAKSTAKDHEVLQLVSSLCKNLSDSIAPAIGLIFEKTFAPTRDMLAQDDARGFPDHRIAFFEMLKSINAFCFAPLLTFLVQSDQLAGFLETVVSGVQNDHPQVADLALTTLNQFIESLTRMAPADCGPIYVRVFSPLITVILTVMTDKLHDSGKEMQIKILMNLLTVVKSNLVALSVSQAESHILSVLSQIAPNIPPAQREAFVRLLMDSVQAPELFRRLMNDLKITVCFGGTLDI